MNIKLLAIVCGLSFWCLGLLVVVGWHSQHDHKSSTAVYPKLKPIEIKACYNCFVELKD